MIWSLQIQRISINYLHFVKDQVATQSSNLSWSKNEELIEGQAMIFEATKMSNVSSGESSRKIEKEKMWEIQDWINKISWWFKSTWSKNEERIIKQRFQRMPEALIPWQEAGTASVYREKGRKSREKIIFDYIFKMCKTSISLLHSICKSELHALIWKLLLNILASLTNLVDIDS